MAPGVDFKGIGLFCLEFVGVLCVGVLGCDYTKDDI